MTTEIGVLASVTAGLVMAMIIAIYFWRRSSWELKQLNNPERVAENQKAGVRTRRGQLQADIEWWEREDTALGREMVEMLTEQLTELGPAPVPPPVKPPSPKPVQDVLPLLLENSGSFLEGDMDNLVRQWREMYAHVEKLESTLPEPQQRSIGEQGQLDWMQTRLSALDQQIREAERSIRG